jgi:hypothetical protein
MAALLSLVTNRGRILRDALTVRSLNFEATAGGAARFDGPPLRYEPTAAWCRLE